METSRRKPLDRLSIALIALFAVLAVTAAIVAFIFVKNIVLGWSTTDLPGLSISSPETNNISNQVPGIDATSSPEQMAAPMQAPDAGPNAQAWDGAGRVNVLIMGLDYRDWESGETPRTDTMILFTLDPVHNTAGMISIPRDMWVNIPGFNYAKINTAYYLGEIYKMPGGGPAMAVKAVEQFLGVPINYYAQIDFYSFIKFIDSLGGLDINIPEKITVDPLGPGNTITLLPGVQTLDGATTLAFARNRHIEGDDFGRASNQQLVIMEIRRQILDFNMLPTLISKSPQLYQDLSGGVRTNMSMTEVIQLALAAAKVPENQIKKGVIGPPDQVGLAKSPDGLSILIPVPDRIRLLRDKIFAGGAAIAPSQVGDDLSQLVKDEQARVVIQNGTQTPGLATRTSEFFRSQGMNVVQETNADRIYNTTSLVIVNGKPYTIKYLADLMGIKESSIVNQYTPDAGMDVVVILGNDWNANNPLP